MAIIEECDESLFISRFEDYKRVVTPENPNGNFTYKGLRALFEYLDNLSRDTGENIELDVISLCCDYSEYKNLDEYLEDYSTPNDIKEKKSILKEEGANLTKEQIEEEFKEQMEQEISEKTTLIKFENDLNEGFIIQQY